MTSEHPLGGNIRANRQSAQVALAAPNAIVE